MTAQLLTSDSDVEQLLARYAHCSAVVVDTEFMRRNTFYPKVALLQLCFDDPDEAATAWLIDPLTLQDTGPISRLLSDPARIKVLHSASEDLEVFQHWLGCKPLPLFDTQRAAALVNIGFGMGYSNLVRTLLDIELPKGETRSDWLQRPLTMAQCEYAAQDVTHLLQVWRQLRELALEQGRYDWILADGADAVASGGVNGAQYYRRVKGAGKLNRQQLGVLAALCSWREEVATSRDKPRGWILDDRSCLELAQAQPQSLRALRDLPDLPPPVLRRYGETLVELLERQREVAEAQWPALLPRPLTPAQRDRLKRLKQTGRALAERLSLAPEALLPGKDYELLLRESSGETIEYPLHWRGWRDQQVIAPLRDSLAGGRQ